jgi:UDP-GlcNAc3NAcA epimerase
VLTDHCADLLFCPTQTAVDNLTREGINKGVHLVGDTLYDAVIQFTEIARQRSIIMKDLGLQPKGYLLATVHRPYKTDDPQTLRGLLAVLIECGETVVFPVHPRTRQKISDFNLLSSTSENREFKMIDPVGYLDMLVLEQSARLILTDSGAMQKEAYWLGVPCLTLREETEWVETVESGWNLLVGTKQERILTGLQHSFPPADQQPRLFGDGQSAPVIVHILEEG